MEDLIFDLKRKLFHIHSVVYVIFYYFVSKFCSSRVAIFSIILALIFFAMLEFLQIKFKMKIPFFHRFYRESERSTFSGNIYLLIGIIIALSVFDFNVAATAILMMAFGDTAAALIGKLGNHKIDHLGIKLEGIIAEFLVDIAVGFIFLNSIPVIILMALAATAAESLLAPIDDNLSVPLVAGFAGQSLLTILKIFGFA